VAVRLAPFLPENLIVEHPLNPPWSEDAWEVAVLRSLAEQLGVANDFYYPLIGIANRIEIRR
jgi:hypothetical protein